MSDSVQRLITCIEDNIRKRRHSEALAGLNALRTRLHPPQIEVTDLDFMATCDDYVPFDRDRWLQNQ